MAEEDNAQRERQKGVLIEMLARARLGTPRKDYISKKEMDAFIERL
jgi:hypothetical protein